MIVVPTRFAYVLIPRTGSRAMERAFLDHVPTAQDVGRHHGYVMGFKEPVYATIRNPADQVLSHWWKRRHEITIEQYIKERTPRLNIHPVDKYFRYDWGLTEIFRQLGYNVTVEKIGVSGVDKSYLTKETIKMINKTFAEDYELYQAC